MAKKSHALFKSHPTAQSAHITAVFLKNIATALPQFLFWKDKNSVYLGCNANYARLVGLSSPADIVGKTDRDLHWQPSGHTAETFVQADQDTLSGHSITNQEEILVLPNGQTLVTLVSKLPIKDVDGTMLGIVGYFTDISELKQKEQALQKAKREADAANQAKSRFIANMSHDIRTPLTGLLGMAEILSQKLTAAESQSAIQDILNAGRQLLNLLNEVIEFAKLENGALPVYELKFNLQALVNDVIALIKPAADAKRLPLQVHFDKNIPAPLIGDSTRLQRILRNLLTNAIRFTHHGQVNLDIALARRQRQHVLIRLQVQDTGIGIPADKQEIIFTQFSRLHPAYQGIYAGHGLGLALVKRFVTELEGEIEVDSREHQGSTFTCLIPLRVALLQQHNNMETLTAIHSQLQQKSKSQREPTEHFSHEPVHPGKKILLVEDNRLAQNVIKHQFEKLKCTIETADTGAQALEKIHSSDYDLIIFDLGLPDQDGCEVAQAARQWQVRYHRHRSVMVALSAHLDDERRQQCVAVGMVRVLSKPLTQSQAQELLTLLSARRKKS